MKPLQLDLIESRTGKIHIRHEAHGAKHDNLCGSWVITIKAFNGEEKDITCKKCQQHLNKYHHLFRYLKDELK
jgi:hypothetical protein